ncbi:MAG TPA: murein biosynthesis integral membrane protein MurJ [Nitrolancea sp.]|nr:murein biosynthesis integral membrane protein MurJ [Nitrolancea sp.]
MSTTELEPIEAAVEVQQIEESGKSDRSKIVQGAAIIMAGTMLSRVLGLGREQITSWLFGTGDAVAAYTIADNIHTMLYDLVISGMIQAAIVPVLSGYAAPELREEFRRITGALLMLAVIFVGGAVVILEILAPQAVTVMTVFGGGAQARGESTVQLTVILVRMILPAVFLLSIAAVMMSSLYSLQRFARPAISVAVRNFAIIVVALLLGRSSLGIKSMQIGIICGALALIAIQAPGLRDALPKPNLNIRHPAIRRILALYIPISIGLVSNAIALVVDRNLAWGVGENALGAMRYATTLNQMILGLVATATSIAALPALSRHFAAGDTESFQRTLSNGLKMVTIMVVPATLGLAAIGWPTVRLLFYHGATNFSGAHAIFIALLAYLPGTFFAAFDQVLIFTYYARQNTKTPVIVGVLAVGVYFLIALTTVDRFGMVGLVLANSAQFTFHAIVMWVLVKRLLGRVGDSTVVTTFWKSLLAGGIMTVAVYGIYRLMQMTSFASVHGAAHLSALPTESTSVFIPIGVGFVTYLVGLRLLGVEEIHAIQQGVMRRLGRATS